jgi:hypothetical protein
MAVMAAAAPFLMLAGTAVSAVGTIAAGRQAAAIGAMEQQRLMQAGDAAEKASKYQARQLEVQSKNEMAAGQREAEQHRRQKSLALSKLTANAAAGGFTATDPTALALSDDITEYGTLQEQMAMFGGASRAAGLRSQAEAARYSGATAQMSGYSQGNIAMATGQAKQNASYYNAAGTILGGVGSFGSSYAKLQPSAPVGRYG